MASFATDNLGAKSAVIIKDTSSDYAKGLAENFSSKFESEGGTIVGEESYVAGDTDFQAIFDPHQVAELRRDLPARLLQRGRPDHQAGPRSRHHRTDPGRRRIRVPTLLQLAGASALNNVYYARITTRRLDYDNAKVGEFIANFKAKYNEDRAPSRSWLRHRHFVADAIGRTQRS